MKNKKTTIEKDIDDYLIATNQYTHERIGITNTYKVVISQKDRDRVRQLILKHIKNG